MPDNTLSTLNVIRTKIRRLSRSPSPTQLTDAELDDYINTFILYDFPEHLKLFSLRQNFSFYTEPYVDTYSTVTTPSTHPLYNFKNKYTSVGSYCSIAGYTMFMSQSQEQFYGIYPKTNSIATIGIGDGITTTFAGTLTSIPVLRDNVLFSSVDTDSLGLAVIDLPAYGLNSASLIDASTTATVGSINYITGVYTFSFLHAPKSGSDVKSQTLPYVVSRPTALLYFNDSFVVRPIPDQPYKVELEAYIRPTELLSTSQSPDLAEWWQYIAYGACKKVFEDRQDIASIQGIMPEYKKQELLVLRRTIMNQSKERTSTIYTEQINLSSGFGGDNF